MIKFFFQMSFLAFAYLFYITFVQDGLSLVPPNAKTAHNHVNTQGGLIIPKDPRFN